MKNRIQIEISPRIAPKEMEINWESAIKVAAGNPGTEVVMVFPPGIYPLPDSGVFLYKEIPTPLHVDPPGTEVIFICDEEGDLQITAIKLERKELA